MYSLQTSVVIDDEEFNIRESGDYRMVLDCFKVLEDMELTKQERLVTCLIIFYDGMETIEDLGQLPDMAKAVKAMYEFFNCGQSESPGIHSSYKLVDWESDESLIVSAVNKVAQKEVRAESYIHWWTFMGYYMAVGDSPLSNIVSMRNKIVKGKKLEKHEREFRSENPHYFNWNRTTIQQKEAEDWVRQTWNTG